MLKDYSPKGGFTQADFTIESEQYLKSTTESIEVTFDFNRLNDNTATFTLEIANIYPAHNASAFTLNSESFSMTENSDTLVIGEIDWSVLGCDSTLIVTLKVLESETIETGTNTESLTIEFHKEAAPIINFGNITLDKYFDFNATEDMSTTIEIFNAIDKPAEQEIKIPLQHWFNLTEGTQFDMQQELVIPIGSTNASIKLDVYNAAFAANERGGVWVEVHKEDVPDGLSVNISSDYWLGANIGKIGEIIKLYGDSTYNAEVFYANDLDPNIPLTITLDISDVPVLQDLTIPITLNEYYAKEGIHFLMPNKYITIKAGETTGTIEFEMLPNGFTINETLRLWVQLDTDNADYEEVSFDATDWWTAVDLSLKGEVYTVTLLNSASYDVLISDVSTTVDVDVVLTDVLDKVAPSDLEIPIRFNEWNLQMDTHFTSDGIIRVNEGETFGTITISVIGSAFAAGESKSLWIEVYNDDMPTDPILIRNISNWWTTLNVGKL